MTDQSKPQESRKVYMSYSELTAKFRAVERKREHLVGYIVFTEESFTTPYSEESRTYRVSSDNKAYIPNMGGYSIYASCIDGTDPCVRLEQYMAAEWGGRDGWQVERCYCMSDELARVAHLLKPDKSRER